MWCYLFGRWNEGMPSWGFGHMLTDEQIEQVGEVDILLLPVEVHIP